MHLFLLHVTVGEQSSNNRRNKPPGGSYVNEGHPSSPLVPRSPLVPYRNAPSSDPIISKSLPHEEERNANSINNDKYVFFFYIRISIIRKKITYEWNLLTYIKF